MALKRATIIKAVKAAFKGLGDVVQPATFRRTTSLYNPNNGTMSTTNVDTSIEGILTGFSNFEVDRVTVLAFDVKFIMEKRLLSIIPSPTTDKVIADGKTYNIVRFIKDPVGATYTLHLRSPS